MVIKKYEKCINFNILSFIDQNKCQKNMYFCEHERNCGEKKFFLMFIKNYISHSYGLTSMSILNLSILKIGQSNGIQIQRFQLGKVSVTEKFQKQPKILVFQKNKKKNIFSYISFV